MKKFCVTADYRPKNPNKPKYYVLAEDEATARKKFAQTYTWLKVYDCEETDCDTDYAIRL